MVKRVIVPSEMTRGEIADRIGELMYTESIFEDENKKDQLVELYMLRDYNMNLDLKNHIIWALEKLQKFSSQPLRRELTCFKQTKNNFDFYNSCTFEELSILGY